MTGRNNQTLKGGDRGIHIEKYHIFEVKNRIARPSSFYFDEKSNKDISPDKDINSFLFKETDNRAQIVNSKDKLKYYLKPSNSENKMNFEQNSQHKKITINKVSVTLGGSMKKYTNRANSLMQSYTETTKDMRIVQYSLKKNCKAKSRLLDHTSASQSKKDAILIDRRK